MFKLNCACPICGTAIDKPGANLHDDRYGYPGEFPLYRCPACGHRVLAVSFSEAEIRELYSDYYPRSNRSLDSYAVPEDKSDMRLWFEGDMSSPFRWVPKGVKVLDIGCGFGESLGYYEQRECDAYGVEADENIRRVAERFGFTVHVGLFDPDMYQEDSFDYVTMAQVIEHVTDPLANLKGVARVLKYGGTLILSTPNSNGWGAKIFGKKWINWHAPYHLQHFSRKSMGIAAKKAGLKIERLRTITSSEWLYYQWLHLATYPGFGEPSAFWTETEMSRRQRRLARFASGLHRVRVNDIVTRFFDAMGVGDNFLFVLTK